MQRDVTLLLVGGHGGGCEGMSVKGCQMIHVMSHARAGGRRRERDRGRPDYAWKRYCGKKARRLRCGVVQCSVVV
jgi:hypothetical protein